MSTPKTVKASMRILLPALTPAAFLLFFISCAGILAYYIAVLIGDTIPLAKLISKTTLIFLVLCIYPTMRWLQLNKQDIGFQTQGFFKQVGTGLLVGIAILLPIIISLWVLDLWHYDLDKNWTAIKILTKVLGILIIAFLVSVPEEFIFRGILLSGLNKKLGIWLSIVISALYYAGLHFLKSKIDIPTSELSLMSSVIIIDDAFNNLLKPSNFTGFMALFTVGAFLGCVRMRLPQSIALCIGIHAGWVFLIKLTSAFLDKTRTSDLQFLVSPYDGIIGPLVSVWLVLFTLYFIYKTKPLTKQHDTIS